MAQWLRRVTVSRVTRVQFQRGVETLRHPLAILRGASQCTDTRAFILLLSMIYFFLDFVSGDLALTGF